jgi:hypothetical protein
MGWGMVWGLGGAGAALLSGGDGGRREYHRSCTPHSAKAPPGGMVAINLFHHPEM